MRQKSEAQQYLSQVEKLDIIIRNKLIEQQQWKDIALGITANMEGERVQSSGGQSKMESALIKCIDMEQEINKIIDDLVNVKMDVIQTIEALYSPIEYNVVHMRYIQFKDLQEIADHYNKSYDWAKTTHGRALAHVQILLRKKCLSPSVTKTP
jgi:hypothetical protein